MCVITHFLPAKAIKANEYSSQIEGNQFSLHTTIRRRNYCCKISRDLKSNRIAVVFRVVFLFAQNKFRRLMSAACSFLGIYTLFFFFFFGFGFIFPLFLFLSLLWHFLCFFHSLDTVLRLDFRGIPHRFPSHLHFPRPFSGQWLTISTLNIGQKKKKKNK